MLNCIIDVSHWQSNVDFQRAKDSGIRAVILKATQGTFLKDALYAKHKAAAEEAGLLIGAYHFGAFGDGVAQADYFLEMVRPTEQTVLALDFERNTTGGSMTLAQARDFVSTIHAKTGRWPVLYSGNDLKEKLGNASDPILRNCPLWIAQYASKPTIPKNWDRWAFWQYTDGQVGPQPHVTDGVGACDREYFNGTEADLLAFWNITPDPTPMPDFQPSPEQVAAFDWLFTKGVYTESTPRNQARYEQAVIEKRIWDKITYPALVAAHLG